jgi:exopolysaccharide production protein ExoZ
MDNYISASVNPQSNKYDIIQVLRFIAALMVITLHSTYYASERLVHGLKLYGEGYNGVGLFFTISGFVMIISSQKLMKKVGGWKIFAVKRVVRIVPIYWVMTSYKLIVLLLTSSLVYHARFDIVYVLKSYFFIPAINVDGLYEPFLSVGWTLNFEMFFYLLFTVALAIRTNATVFLSLIFIPLAVLSIFKTSHWPAVGFYADSIVLDFLYGMIAAQLIIRGKKLSAQVAIPLILIGLLYLFFPKSAAMVHYYSKSNIVVGLATFLVVYGAACIEGKFGDKMPGWLVYLGSASYSLYLVHPVIAPLAPTLLNKIHLKLPALSVAISLVFAITAGTIFYRFCEKPLSDFLAKWTKNKGWT